MTAIQKSSRTTSRHWRCVPSHCRRGPEQIAVLNVEATVQPLLKLIEHNQELFSRAEDVTPPDGLQRFGHIQRGKQIGAFPSARP